jgi:dihydrofolate reductase
MKKNKVFFDMALSLDGFIAPEGMDMAHMDNPEYKQWAKKWSELMGWAFPQKFFRENLKLGDGGETGEVNDFVEETFKRTGVSIMGANMFAGGEKFWPEEAPFHTPVFVLTNKIRSPWERPGGTVFYFINDGIESALEQAKKVAGDKDIRISGGASVVQQYLNAGLIDEFTIHYAPVIFGKGTPLFLNTNPNINIKIKKIIHSKDAIHVSYEIEKQNSPNLL